METILRLKWGFTQGHMTKVSVLSYLRISGCELKDNYYISFI